MGGKKGPEKNRKYEKDRRDRFNEQFVELQKLLPDFNTSPMKATKAEIITKTIQYLKDTQTQTLKFEDEFENEKMKVSELQKKVSGLLHVVKELIKLLHKSNIRFPSSLAVDDFKNFPETFTESKKKMKSSISAAKSEKLKNDLKLTATSSDSECDEKSTTSELSSSIVSGSREALASTATLAISCVSKSAETHNSVPAVTSEAPKALKLNSNAVIVPNGNLLAVNGIHNAGIDYCSPAPSLLLNKPFAVPTVILMQNNFVPVNAIQHIAVSQRTQKLIMPKQTTINTTKTTFINKKPIPTVRLYKSSSANKDGVRKTSGSRRRRSRRSKGILVKYPKRKPPTKNKKREIRPKKLSKVTKTIGSEDQVANKGETFAVSAAESSYAENTADVDKTFSCSDSILNTPEMPSSGQFMDFFDNTPRCIDNAVASNASPEFAQGGAILKAEKSQMDGFAANTFEQSFADANLNCGLIESSHKEKIPSKEPASGCKNRMDEKDDGFVRTPSGGDSLLLKYAPSIGKSYAPVENESSPAASSVAEKSKPGDKVANTPLRSATKDISLSLIDDKKHYEPSFDEFSNDLFTSLQVPSSGHNADSISPTAAFLQTFPLVSSGPNVDLLPEHDDDSVTPTTATTILQIGNLESPSTLLFASKPANRDGGDAKVAEPDSGAAFASYCAAGLGLDGGRGKDKKDQCKEIGPQQSFAFSDAPNFGNQSKTSCAKDVPQNTSLYSATSSAAAATFSSYNIFTKYNDIPAPATCSYYSFCSQPFAAPKTADTVAGDYNSWMPPVYGGQEESSSAKDKAAAKRDKCAVAAASVATHYGSASSEVAATVDRAKTKKHKANNARPLVNWMTSPDLRNAAPVDASHAPADAAAAAVFALPKDDVAAGNANNSFLGANASNNANYNAYACNDYFVDGQGYADAQLGGCKMPYSSATAANYSWSPSKSALPLPIDAHNMIIPSTLPTLVGDLALGNTTSSSASFNGYDSTTAAPVTTTTTTTTTATTTRKYEAEKKKVCRNYCKSVAPNVGSFLSVTQLVDDKSAEKTAKKHPLDGCHFDEDGRDKCDYVAGGVGGHGKSVVAAFEYAAKKPCVFKDAAKGSPTKCKKDATKYQAAPRYASKENKKEARPKTFGDEYSMQTCQQQQQQLQTKEPNPLASKNSNYSAESLIGSSHQNTCSGVGNGYCPYENAMTNYGGACSAAGNEYARKRGDEAETLANVGYYPNANYVYHNNFQSFNNYGFSNQCYNNYAAGQIQSTGFQKRKDDVGYAAKQDPCAEWGLPSYNAIVPAAGEFSSNQKLDSKCKQPFSSSSSSSSLSANKYHQPAKNNADADSYNKYYQGGGVVASSNLTPSKSNCAYSSSYGLDQGGVAAAGQHCAGGNFAVPGYDMKSMRNSNAVHGHNAQSATSSLTNFNLSTIFPEINDKHCAPNRVGAIGHEKSDPKYKASVDDMNYNYLLQPTAENGTDHLYGPSSFLTDFASRKMLK